MRSETVARNHRHQEIAKACVALALLCAACTTNAMTCAHTDLMPDGQFNTPVVNSGALQMLPAGSSVGSWRVVGSTGEVALLGKLYSEGGFSISDFGDDQVMNLAFGGGGAAAGGGIATAVATRPGAEYDLHFSVGNLVDTTGSLGTSSTVTLKIDGVETEVISNSLGAGSSVKWQHFDIHFQATSASTTLEFRNADPINDHANFLAFIHMYEAGTPDCGGSAASSDHGWLLVMIPLFLRRFAFAKTRVRKK